MEHNNSEYRFNNIPAEIIKEIAEFCGVIDTVALSAVARNTREALHNCKKFRKCRDSNPLEKSYSRLIEYNNLYGFMFKHEKFGYYNQPACELLVIAAGYKSPIANYIVRDPSISIRKVVKHICSDIHSDYISEIYRLIAKYNRPKQHEIDLALEKIFIYANVQFGISNNKKLYDICSDFISAFPAFDPRLMMHHSVLFSRYDKIQLLFHPKIKREYCYRKVIADALKEMQYENAYDYSSAKDFLASIRYNPEADTINRP